MTTSSDLLHEAERLLHRARSMVAEEIAEYPTPIAGCDAQFNHLLAERARIAASLHALQGTVFVPTPRTPTPGAGIESR